MIGANGEGGSFDREISRIFEAQRPAPSCTKGDSMPTERIAKGIREGGRGGRESTKRSSFERAQTLPTTFESRALAPR
jgi:hypothetical protein